MLAKLVMCCRACTVSLRHTWSHHMCPTPRHICAPQQHSLRLATQVLHVLRCILSVRAAFCVPNFCLDGYAVVQDQSDAAAKLVMWIYVGLSRASLQKNFQIAYGARKICKSDFSQGGRHEDYMRQGARHDLCDCDSCRQEVANNRVD